jgi:hypothetical protein
MAGQVLRVRLKGYALARLRVQLALPLVWLAAKIAGLGFGVVVVRRREK